MLQVPKNPVRNGEEYQTTDLQKHHRRQPLPQLQQQLRLEDQIIVITTDTSIPTDHTLRPIRVNVNPAKIRHTTLRDATPTSRATRNVRHTTRQDVITMRQKSILEERIRAITLDQLPKPPPLLLLTGLVILSIVPIIRTIGPTTRPTLNQLTQGNLTILKRQRQLSPPLLHHPTYPRLATPVTMLWRLYEMNYSSLKAK